MKKMGCILAAVLIAASVYAAELPTSQPAAQNSMENALGPIRVDPAARRVTLPATVCLREGALEFLLCRVGTKEHESVLHTDVPAAALHAGLLALGLRPGLPAELLPDGSLLPPRGGNLRVRLQWHDADGQMHSADASEWIRPTDSRATPPGRWVFVGSEVLPGGTYWADVEGGIISVANFASAVVDVPFPSTDANEALLFEAAAEAVPSIGTEVTVIIEPLRDTEPVAFARATVQIDPQGGLWADGQAVDAETLTRWAGEFISHYAQGRVELRAAGEATVWDVELALRALRLGGVRDIAIKRIPPAGPLLPRTNEQLSSDLAAWSDRLANPRDYIQSPAEQARAMLEHVQRRLDELDRLRELWGKLAAGLRKALAEGDAAPQEAQP